MSAGLLLREKNDFHSAQRKAWHRLLQKNRAPIERCLQQAVCEIAIDATTRKIESSKSNEEVTVTSDGFGYSDDNRYLMRMAELFNASTKGKALLLKLVELNSSLGRRPNQEEALMFALHSLELLQKGIARKKLILCIIDRHRDEGLAISFCWRNSDKAIEYVVSEPRIFHRTSKSFEAPNLKKWATIALVVAVACEMLSGCIQI